MPDTQTKTKEPTGPASAATGRARKAVLYRMVMDKHICPFGLKSRDLLKRKGFEVEEIGRAHV